MSRCFLFNEDCHFVPAWIQIHGLPPDCWTQKVLNMIGSKVGKPLYTDNLTRTRDRLEYARLLVEILAIGERVYEVPITLPTEVQVDLRIIYESLSDFYKMCKRLGHRLDTCRRSDGLAGQQANRSGDNVQNGANEKQQWRPRSQSTRGWGRTRTRLQDDVDHNVEVQNVEDVGDHAGDQVVNQNVAHDVEDIGVQGEATKNVEVQNIEAHEVVDHIVEFQNVQVQDVVYHIGIQVVDHDGFHVDHVGIQGAIEVATKDDIANYPPFVNTRAVEELQ
ncbi:uncharacterized protein LOC121987954 [Zingiber officinale]|uniref:uncharacterized protein LOC121987954 n=1 Tax=Zingiber officinale TaxID=94328 RepID=UPI001C4C12A5|nr:uncharacterized protein LOC121987954 [Zingiber officinale]